MSHARSAPRQRLGAFEQLRYAQEIIRLEAQALEQLTRRLDMEFCRAVELLLDCRGSVIVTGIGKAGLIGAKIAATLASTGSRSHFLHPSEAVHGDLGRVHSDDLVLALSNSGESQEVLQLLPALGQLNVCLVAVTGRPTSTLARAATVVLNLGPLQEACPWGLAPSTSTTAMLALGDALALVTSRARGFGPNDFARFHPGGSLGRKLSKVDDYMRPARECRLARDTTSVRQVLVETSCTGRRSGAILCVDEGGRLSGLFTDSDLARLFEARRDSLLDGPIGEVMTARPCTVPSGAAMNDAVEILKERKFSELPVVAPGGEPLGLIDVTDVVGLLPDAPG
ncbi:MAG: KpsF/GutQ family sugar-phosphate isomerase [Pirellulales bacterium]|nr:KpsF/GutQ family sugar-phosphate isomerase [Pirellulales bacterium]